ncbi:aspartate/glutamate racemase family protein, partial [uncultured Salinicola sp.]|uniref:aspartate/glutamate racemase family protein n=1 Tax=uncultured Salinicola sp. TaxID=1193542 RepID=UPI002631E7EA
FSVVTTLARTAIIAEHLLDQYGFRHHCRRVRATDLPVLELENPAGNAYQALLEECQRAREEDGIGAIVLGCGGMADLTERLTHDLQMPVIEGVSAAVKLAESLVSLGLGTSKHGDLAFPRPKPFSGRFADWGV